MKKTRARRNPQDATLRNIRALKKQVATLRVHLRFQMERQDRLANDVDRLKGK